MLEEYAVRRAAGGLLQALANGEIPKGIPIHPISWQITCLITSENPDGSARTVQIRYGAKRPPSN